MLHWLRNYRRAWIAGDISAGVVVAMMMIPQGLAYALVAGLPPVAGLYASIVPSLCYALLGTSMTQSVGPMAIVSLMTGAALAPLAVPGTALYVVLAAQLALVAGAALFLAGVLRVGFIANFFSRPVMSGFTLGATIVIVWGQVEPLLGADFPGLHWPSALLGIGSMLLLFAARRYLAPLLRRAGMTRNAADIGARLAPMAVVLAGLALVTLLDLRAAGVATTGAIPSGLPALNLATSIAHWGELLRPGLLIAFIVFLVSMSGAQVLARGEKLDSDRELLALGAANLGSSLSGGFPVTGSLSRSAVNFAAGANTPLASVLTAILLALALVLPTGWLSLLPLPVLAATIIVAVVSLMELDTLRTAWRYDRADALALGTTCAGVLLAGVQQGVVIGVVLSMGTLIWRASRPHIAVLGRIAGSEHFRNVERHQVETVPGLLIMRIDANLFFGNVEEVHKRIEEELARQADTRDLVLVLSAVSSIDTTALFALEAWNTSLLERGIRLHLAEVKGPVMDRLKQSELPSRLGGKLFLSTAMAASELSAQG